MRRVPLLAKLALVSTAAVIVGACSGESAAERPQPPVSDIQAVTAWGGWDPNPNPLPPMNCTDDSYSRAPSGAQVCSSEMHLVSSRDTPTQLWATQRMLEDFCDCTLLAFKSPPAQ
jgi:hypothetical protein